MLLNGLKRVGVLGGSFDPVHKGHASLAHDALEQMQLDKVLFVPASQSPHKDNAPRVLAAERLEMLRLALEEEPHFDVFEWELKQGGVSYSIDVVERLTQSHPEIRFFWIIGADQLAQLPRWKSIDKITNCIEFICARRPGYTQQIPACLSPSRLHLIEGSYLNISSSIIRERLEQGENPQNLLNKKVYEHIKHHNFYQQTR